MDSYTVNYIDGQTDGKLKESQTDRQMLDQMDRKKDRYKCS